MRHYGQEQFGKSTGTCTDIAVSINTLNSKGIASIKVARLCYFSY